MNTCANCKHCEAYGKHGHHVCRVHAVIFRGLEPAFNTCDDWEPI